MFCRSQAKSGLRGADFAEFPCSRFTLGTISTGELGSGSITSLRVPRVRPNLAFKVNSATRKSRPRGPRYLERDAGTAVP